MCACLKLEMACKFSGSFSSLSLQCFGDYQFLQAVHIFRGKMAKLQCNGKRHTDFRSSRLGTGFSMSLSDYFHSSFCYSYSPGPPFSWDRGAQVNKIVGFFVLTIRLFERFEYVDDEERFCFVFVCLETRGGSPSCDAVNLRYENTCYRTCNL